MTEEIIFKTVLVRIERDGFAMQSPAWGADIFKAIGVNPNFGHIITIKNTGIEIKPDDTKYDIKDGDCLCVSEAHLKKEQEQ